ncbi:MAG: sulfite exporter TauE/SafE family protein [Phycisphaerales bacterium]|nr:sulfite exporter TauE/SafE family protein [Phycisphaerales bacterium]
MPELFPTFPDYLISALVMAGAMFIYATVGFGAGMFAVAVLAFVLPDFAGTVAVLMLLTFVTEVSVLARTWRQADFRVVLALVLPIGVGLALGTQVLIAGDVHLLKRLLGVVVAGAGVWFYQSERKRPPAVASPAPPEALTNASPRVRAWIAIPIGLISGVLGGLFGTGAPPLIVLLRAQRLDKARFRATLLWCFFAMSLMRAPMYIRSGVLTTDVLWSAVWLLPGAIVGTIAGMIAHHRLSERKFALGVSTLLIIMGILLLISGGKT